MRSMLWIACLALSIVIDVVIYGTKWFVVMEKWWKMFVVVVEVLVACLFVWFV
jgi:hypothetical protein